jgi:hypothetical protein
VDQFKKNLRSLRVRWKDVSSQLTKEIFGYLSRMLDAKWQDKALDQQEISSFQGVVKRFGLDYLTVCRAFAARTQAELESVLNIHYSAGEVPEDVIDEVLRVGGMLCLPPAAIKRLSDLGQRLALLARIRRGELPTYESPIYLDGGERCVFAAFGCRFLQSNARHNRGADVGTLVVSTKSIYFVPRDGGVRSVRLRSVADVVAGPGHFTLTTTKKSLSGTAWVAEADIASEVVLAALGIEKRHMLPSDSEGRSRSIPQSVKHAVWHRDGGRCIQCGSVHSIHFDHVIPFSKGGANNIENLQLLCASCNLSKGNRI